MTSSTTIYSIDDIDYIINEYLIDGELIKKRKTERETAHAYYNLSCSFDIETTSTLINDQKAAFMYCWQMCLNGAVLIGRTWEEFEKVIQRIHDLLGLSNSKRLVLYVHNLSFEFQFIRKRLQWSNVFAIDDREPVRCLSTLGIEFRCSYKLSGYSLFKLGDQLIKYKVQKKHGDLDYSLIRTWKTPLTDKEIGYCANDVLVVASYIQEKIEQDGDITKIPLTKTGYVRQACRDKCFPKNDRTASYHYRDLMKRLTLEPDEYMQLKRAFAGGFTHANAEKVGEVYIDVSSYDFTSSYPAVMLSERFPMSKGRKVDIPDKKKFIYYLRNFCCVFDITLKNIRPKLGARDNPLSFSKCYNVKGYTLNNGRIVYADELTTTMTNVDFSVFIKFYDYDPGVQLGDFRIYLPGYLPKAIIEAVLDFYQAKTTLKDVIGKEVEYLNGKENVNSIYGCIVTDICRDEHIYEGNEWVSNPPNIEEAIKKYNDKYMRFLFYPWGLFITSYARANLFTGIEEFGDDYIYSDTDSIKGVNREKHEDYINSYNISITNKINECLSWSKIPIERAYPKTIKGVEKPLGVWSYEGDYSRFKTLGAKRYMIEKDNEINITVSGLNKKECMPYILSKSKGEGVDPFDFFADDMYIPAGTTGKNTHTYIDHDNGGLITDYMGVQCEVHEYSSVHLSASDYRLSMADEYIKYLIGVKEKKA